MIKPGDTYEHKVSYTQDDVIGFAKVSGDCNPIHLDFEYAAKTPFKRPIVHGFLSASVFSKVFGMLFPGPGTIYLGQQMKFLAPVFTDKTYTARFVVAEVRTDKHIGTVNCSLIDDETGKECISGVATLKHDEQFV